MNKYMDIGPVLEAESRFREQMSEVRPHSDKEVISAVKTLFKKILLFPNKPKIKWLADTEPEDLEATDLAQVTSIMSQLEGWVGANKLLMAKLSYLSKMAQQYVSRYQWQTRERVSIFSAEDLNRYLENKHESQDFLRIYHNNARRGVINSKVIYNHFYTKYKKFVKKMRSKGGKIHEYSPTHSRSMIPTEILNNSYSSFYIPYTNILKVNKDTRELLEACYTITCNLFCFLVINNTVLLVEKPKIHSIHDGRRYLLHNENGPAVYFDRLNTGVYYLNNVRLKKQIVITPADQLSPSLVTTTRNAEVRRELVRKIGLERILSELETETLDKNDKYELITLNLPFGNRRDGNRRRPYLKMLNPSTGTWHIEGVSPNVKTIKEALQYRNNSVDEPIILT